MTSEGDPSLPHCVFCSAPWSTRMLELYNAAGNGAVCSCCVVFPDFEPPPEPEPPRPHIPLPPELACDACGRVLYRLANFDDASDP